MNYISKPEIITDFLYFSSVSGVNVVLNSLAEEKLQASIRCLARHGRFLEIGKYDLSNNSPLGEAETLLPRITQSL